MSIDSVMPSKHLILCRPLLLPPSNFPSLRGFSKESALRIRWPKDWSFSRGPEPSRFLTCSQTIPNPPTPRRNTSGPPGIGVKGHLMNFQSCSFRPLPKVLSKLTQKGPPSLQTVTRTLNSSVSVQSLSRVQLFVTPWTAARQASLPITNS